MALLKAAKDLPINHSHRLSLLMAQNILNKMSEKSSWTSQPHFPTAVLFQSSFLTRSSCCQGNSLLCRSPPEDYSFLCVHTRKSESACFQRDQIPADIHKAGPRGPVVCGGPAGRQRFFLEGRGWGPSATPTCSQALRSLGGTA